MHQARPSESVAEPVDIMFPPERAHHHAMPKRLVALHDLFYLRYNLTWPAATPFTDARAGNWEICRKSWWLRLRNGSSSTQVRASVSGPPGCQRLFVAGDTTVASTRSSPFLAGTEKRHGGSSMERCSISSSTKGACKFQRRTELDPQDARAWSP